MGIISTESMVKCGCGKLTVCPFSLSHYDKTFDSHSLKEGRFIVIHSFRMCSPSSFGSKTEIAQCKNKVGKEAQAMLAGSRKEKSETRILPFRFHPQLSAPSN